MKHSSGTLSAATVALALAACSDGGGWSGAAVSDAAPAVANAPPIISAVESQSVAQDASSEVIAFDVSDPEATAVTVTAKSSNPELISADGIQLVGDGASRGLLLTPMEDATGIATVTLIATDAAGLSSRQSFDVKIASEQRSFREMVGTATAKAAESEGEQIVGYSWLDNPTDDEAAFDYLFRE